MKTLGLRHIALNVKDPQRSKDFYTQVMGMSIEWEPDHDNVYLTSAGQDNLALHKAQALADTKSKATSSVSTLDHIGFCVESLEAVDTWYTHVKNHGAKILREVKTHRDGARSFYFEDPDGIIIQLIYHIPIAERARK